MASQFLQEPTINLNQPKKRILTLIPPLSPHYILIPINHNKIDTFPKNPHRSIPKLLLLNLLALFTNFPIIAAQFPKRVHLKIQFRYLRFLNQLEIRMCYVVFAVVLDL